VGLRIEDIGGAILKNYVVFIVSFIVLLFAFEIVSGMFLTLTYVPETSKHLSSSTVNMFGSGSFNYTFFSSALAATLSFIISKRVFKVKKSL
jgi:quinol-cytochrome oxidoreductase complex cytochrome b subunit